MEQAAAVRADSGHVPKRRGDCLVFHHADGGQLWSATAKAVQLPRCANPPVLRPSLPQKKNQVFTMHKHGSSLIERRQPRFDPGPHGILVDPEERCNLLDLVASVSLHNAKIGMSLLPHSDPTINIRSCQRCIAYLPAILLSRGRAGAGNGCRCPERDSGCLRVQE